jgi:hypothetical protein
MYGPLFANEGLVGNCQQLKIFNLIEDRVNFKKRKVC